MSEDLSPIKTGSSEGVDEDFRGWQKIFGDSKFHSGQVSLVLYCIHVIPIYIDMCNTIWSIYYWVLDA